MSSFYYSPHSKLLAVSVGAILTVALTGCGGTEPDPFNPEPNPKPKVDPDKTEPQFGEEVRSEKQRNRLVSVGSDLGVLVEGNQAFAFDLYQQLRRESGNFFYSPHSISAALAMTHAGARSQTETEMAQALHFTLPRVRLHPAFNALDLALESRGQGAQGQDGQGFRLNIANALWGQIGYPFLMTFLDELAVSYGAGMKLLDFSQKPEDSRVTINDWVSHETEGKIPELLGKETITEATRLVLTNTIYFNAAWKEQFPVKNTYDGDFERLDGSKVRVPMMGSQAQNVFRYASGNGYQAMELPYEGDELSMLVILPDQGTFDSFEDTLDSRVVSDIVASLGPTDKSILLPKWGIRSQMDLSDALIRLGMHSAFSGEADFSGITGNRDLFIAKVIHEAFVSVDEAGTEAGASTAVVLVFGIPERFTVDRPFIFLVRDIESGAILFVGRVLDPTA